jgi:6-pyruvoyltetrahydropterin/6-carboxytetrahydropterin synthase
MYTIIVKIKYEYAHRLLHHNGKCRHVHGHSGEATIELATNTLNGNGFVMDFAEVKAPIKKWINEYWDHAYLANAQDPLLTALQAEQMKVYIFHQEPTAEVMARHLFERINDLIALPNGVQLQRVLIQETCTGIAAYQAVPLDVDYEVQ